MILKKLVEFNVDTADMLKIYILYIRVIIEQSSVVWSSSLTQEEENAIERVQKIALRLIYQENYICYNNALSLSKLPTIKDRFKNLLYKFAVKCTKNMKTENMIPLNENNDRLRQKEKYKVPLARKQRLFKSTIPTMARMLNSNHI